MNRFIIRLFSVIAICFFVIGCGHSWTNEEKADFLKKCEAIDSLPGFSIQLSGFTADEVDSILIRERRNDIVIDSFYVAATNVKEDYICYINKPTHTKSSYEILIPGQAKHVLSNITMGMVPQFTNSGEGWGCGMVRYHVDGFPYNDQGFYRMKIKNEHHETPEKN